MDNYMIFEAFTDIDDIFILSAAELLGYREASMKKRPIKKISKTLLIAAVIASFMIVTALAVGISVHQRRQAELRDRLQIEQNNISSYVEYEEDVSGARLLSSINDGEWITAFVNLSPISPEEVRTLYGGDELITELHYMVNDTGHGGSATPVMPKDLGGGPKIEVTDPGGQTFLVNDPEWLCEKVLENSYDSETQTLTVSCRLYCSWLEELGVQQDEPVKLRFSFNEVRPAEGYSDVETLIDFGEVEIEPSAVQERFAEFDGVQIADKCELVSLRLSPMGVTLGIRHEDSDIIFNLPDKSEDEAAFRKAFELQLEWLGFYDELLSTATLHFADGSAVSLAPSESTPYENGIVYLRSGVGATMDISAVSGITVMGQYLEIK